MFIRGFFCFCYSFFCLNLNLHPNFESLETGYYWLVFRYCEFERCMLYCKIFINFSEGLASILISKVSVVIDFVLLHKSVVMKKAKGLSPRIYPLQNSLERKLEEDNLNNVLFTKSINSCFLLRCSLSLIICIYLQNNVSLWHVRIVESLFSSYYVRKYFFSMLVSLFFRGI